MTCEDILAALAGEATCEQTPSGMRVETHCLYPSFDPVDVFVVRHGEGFIVTDDRLMTSCQGVFAAGDVRKGATKQVASAVGEGATAALMIREYLKRT